MNKPVEEYHYGEMVFVNKEYESVRKDQCMCHKCSLFAPNTDHNCAIASEFYEICREANVAFIVTRCGHAYRYHATFSE
jgi:hypothetical protein